MTAKTPISGPDTGGSRWWKWAAASAVIAVVVVGGGAAVWRSQVKQVLEPGDVTRDLHERLVAALAKSLPNASVNYRAEITNAYVKTKVNRAIAFAAKTQRAWRTSGWPNRELAEERVLEKCQQFYDEPCALIASNDVVVEPSADGSLPVRDAPRVRYTGIFNPERIPGIDRNTEQRMDIAGYLTAASPKASAFHAAGIIYVSTGASSQRAAEEQTLRACNDDPARKQAGGPCYLYSVDNRVVLALRATGAITSAAATPPRSAETSFRDALLIAFAKTAPGYPNRQQQVRQYLDSSPHRAIAVYPPAGSWRTTGAETALHAEERVLEACQVRYGGPCVLVALNDSIQGDGSGANRPRPMPRYAYDGSFDPNQIPGSPPALRQRADVISYRATPGPKAAAFHHWGRLFVVTNAVTQRTAEERALEACNRDSDRGGRDGACLLYAVGDLVVLSKRLIAPITPQ